MRTIQIADGQESLSEAAAEAFARVSARAVEERGRFSVALAGGSTPRAVYSVLSAQPFRERIRWDQVEFFWSDERHVAPDHPDSNYRMAFESLLSKIPLRREQLHRIKGEYSDADAAAREYEEEIRASFGPESARFDLILLGLGTDGHTASLFPGTPALLEQDRLCAANWVAALGVHRITMTLPLINQARVVQFIVSGVQKAEAVRNVLRPADAVKGVPAQLVRPAHGELQWLLDRDAARALVDVAP